jgi:hypothetical protein
MHVLGDGNEDLRRCGIEKPLDQFGFRYPKLGIRHSWCKDCFVEYKRAWYERNGDRHRAHVKERRAVAEDENPSAECGST